jgi:colanic acid biosynthesis glycosyl transferase WcaI
MNRSHPSSRPTRWLILTQYYPPEIGAPQIRLRALARELQRHGLLVEVLTALPNYPTGRIFPGYERRWRVRETIDGVPVRRTWVYAGSGRAVLVRLANYVSFSVTGLVAALLGPRPDVVFVEAQPLSLGVTALLMKWLRGARYIYNVPDLQVDVARQLGFLENEMVLGMASAAERFFARQSWRVSTVTHRFIDHFCREGLPREQITFLPNGADTDFLKPEDPSAELMERWNLWGKKTFLYVGTHAFYHGLDTILDAAQLLRDRADIAFVLVGHGPERPRLKALARDRQLSNVIFADSPYDERSRLYSIACASLATLRDVEVARRMRLAKVFPSLSCGVPVIYSGQGEGAELVAAEGCGVAVAAEDADALARAVAELAANPELRAQMGQAGRRLIEREYAWSTIVNRWLRELGVVAIVPPSTGNMPVVHEETI